MSVNTGPRSNPQWPHDHDYNQNATLYRSRSSDSVARQDTIHLTPSYTPSYTPSIEGHGTPSSGVYPPWGGSDIRSISTLSLGPSESESIDGRRKLLLIYVHGFMGAETSFQKFPAHVHNLVTIALAETHVVYSKVYPRYKSRRAIDIASDDLSQWLSPHESDNTDVILLGHSLGGILAAEVALIPSAPLSIEIFKHRILGLINFDVPFLGMHPRVISTGLGSLFQPKRKDRSLSPQRLNDTPPTASSDELSNRLSSVSLDDQSPSPFSTPSNDPNFDPAFPNDIHRVKRTQLDGAIHFFKKNSGRLKSAVQEYFASYLEFGGCLADYPGLHARYRKLRELEKVDEQDLKRDSQGRFLRRIRLVNYYTASTGFIRSSSPEKIPNDARSDTELTPSIPAKSVQVIPQLPVPPIAADGSQGEKCREAENDTTDAHQRQEPYTSRDFKNELENSQSSYIDIITQNNIPTEFKVNENLTSILEILPPLTTLPDGPSEFDPSQYHDKETLKLAQKEHSRLVKAYEKAKKDHEKAIKGREKLVRKIEKTAAKKQTRVETQKFAKQETDTRKDNEIVIVAEETSTAKKSSGQVTPTPTPTPTLPPLPPRKPSSSVPPLVEKSQQHDTETAVPPPNPSPPTSASPPTASPSKPLKDRKFCALPSGNDDLWVRVFMEGIDEVVAHQSMFIPNTSSYERLVGDTMARIEEWVHADCTKRLIWSELEGERLD